MSYEELLEDARLVIEEARAEGAEEFYALVSGGKDSLATASVAFDLGVLDGIIYIDTTIRVPDSLEHVKQVAFERGWPEVTVLTTKKTFESFVLKYGFPRPSSHTWAFNSLKWYPLWEFRRDTKDRNICFLSGVRRLESRRRMGHVTRFYREPKKRGDRMMWAAPIINWSTPEVLSYLVDKGIVISPAYKKIGISGDCLCGAYARAGEAELIAKHYPEVAEQIRLLEEKAKGRTSQKTWGNATSISTAKKQKSIEEYACFDCAFSD